MNRFIHYVQQLGDLLIYFFKLHINAILHILLGGVLLGIFPSLTSLIEILHDCFETKTYVPLHFGDRWRRHFIISNTIGWILSPICLFILFELYLSIQFVRLSALNLFLCMVLILMISVLLWSLVSQARYQLLSLQHIKQGFFLLLASLFDTLTIGLATLFAVVICIIFPFALLFWGMPLLILPLSWFSYKSTRRIENRNLLNRTKQ